MGGGDKGVKLGAPSGGVAVGGNTPELGIPVGGIIGSTGGGGGVVV